MSSNPDTSPGTQVVAAVRRIGESRLTRVVARAACDELLVELAVATAGPGNWTVRHSSGAAPTLLHNGQPSQASISVAHSGHWIAAGIAINASIGVDIQVHKDKTRLSSITDLLDLPTPNCGGSHLNADSHYGGCHRDWGWFFDAWVLRESMAKVTGGSLLERHAGEHELAVACENRGKAVRAAGFEALVERIEPMVSFAVVTQHHQVMRHCA